MLKWNQEFVFGVGSAQSSLSIRVLDWNRFTSNKPLGDVTIDLGSLVIGRLYDDWRSLSMTGEIRVIIHLCKVEIPKPQSFGARLGSTRLQLERTVYYPGHTIRGAMVFGTQKVRKYHAVRVIIEGHSNTYWSTGSGKHRRHYHGCCVFMNCTAAFLGTPVGKTETISLGPSVNIYPFEYVLPLHLPPTFDLMGNGTSWNRNAYRVIAFADVAGKANKLSLAHFRVLAHPSHIRTDISLNMMAPVNKSTDMRVEISGATQAWIGEQYQMSVKVENHSTKPIEYLQVRLKGAYWFSAKGGYGSGPWVRTGGFWMPVVGGVWNCSNLPGLPIAPGTTWSGTVQVTIPSALIPSLHSTYSPLIQNGYRIGVKLATSGNVFSKASGSTRYMITLANRYSEFETLVPPVEPEGPLGKLISAPAPPDIATKLVPAPTTDGKTVVCAGQAFGSVAAYPGAFYPAQAIVPTMFAGFSHASFYPTIDEWQPGKVPSWLKNAIEGLNPSELASVDFTTGPDAAGPGSPVASSSAPH